MLRIIHIHWKSSKAWKYLLSSLVEHEGHAHPTGSGGGGWGVGRIPPASCSFCWFQGFLGLDPWSPVTASCSCITQVSAPILQPPLLSMSSFLSLIRTPRASLVAQMVRNLPVTQETWVWSLGWEEPLKKMATHSSILAWEIHGQGSLVGYSPWGSKNVGQGWGINTHP